MLITTKIINSSTILNLTSSAYELLPSLTTGEQYELEKIVLKFVTGSSLYNFSTSSFLRFFVDSDYLAFVPTSNIFNVSEPTSTSILTDYIHKNNLNISVAGEEPSGATTGDGTLQFDIYYNLGNVTQEPIVQFQKLTRGSDNQALADFSSAEGYNTTSGTKYSTSTTIVSGSVSPSVPSSVDVPGFPQVGSRILLDDTNYSNIYGKIILDVDSYVQNAGPPETTTIYLTNPSIQTPTASIYFLDYPRSGDSISGSYSHTEGSNTNAFGEYSHAEGDSTIAIGNSSHASGIGTIAYGTGQTVTGKYNLFNNSDLFIIGNGTDNATRSNIVAISNTSVSITGSLNVSTDINANLNGTASWATNAVTAATALTASHAPSYVLTSTTSSMLATYLLTSQTSSFIGNSQTSSMSVLSSSFALTASNTPNALITASVSSNTLTFTKGNGTTFNLTVNTGSVATTPPGGGDTNIQFNQASAFGGTSQFVYDYNNNRINYNNSTDPYSTPLTNANNNTIELFNNINNIQVSSVNYQFTTAQFPYCKYIVANAVDKVISLDTNAGTSVAPGLLMHSFKCDYTISNLTSLDVLVEGSRTGTLYCVWDEDNATYNPVITDTFTTSTKGIVNKLDDAVFTVGWNGASMELSLDLTLLPALNIIFNGFFTVFSMKP